ncbi:MAG: hypothetical protein ACLVGL_03890 [Waltera sp.]
MMIKYWFLSRPNPFLDSHQYFILKLQEHFENYNIQTVTLQADNYDLTDSINYLKGMIKQCYGIVIIGFKQIFIETGSKKKEVEKILHFTIQSKQICQVKP